MTTNLTRYQQLSPQQRLLLLNKLQGLRTVQATPAWSPLTPLQLQAGATPIYFVHPAGGALFWYLPLLKQLGDQCNAYGLQGHGLYGDQQPLTTIEAMADAYADAILAHQPSGPYTLAGYSMGGVIAFAVAQALQAKGERVANLFLFDAYLYTERLPFPGRDLVDPDERLLVRMLAALPHGHSRQLHQTLRRLPSHAARIDHLFQAGRAVGRIPANYTVEELRRMYDAMAAHVEALTSYRPQPYAGPVRFFRCNDRSESDIVPYIPWSVMITRGLHTHNVPGKHSTLLEEPNVQTVAHLVHAVLSQKEVAV